MTPDRIITAHATEAEVLGRIHVLWQRRAVDRRVFGAAWPPARHDREVLLRELVRLVRSARKLARRTIEAQDAISASKAYVELGYHAAQAVGPVA